jgi:hypothetical protein
MVHFPSPFPETAGGRAYHSTARNQTKFAMVAPVATIVRPELVHSSSMGRFFAKIQLPNHVFRVNLAIL